MLEVVHHKFQGLSGFILCRGSGRTDGRYGGGFGSHWRWWLHRLGLDLGVAAVPLDQFPWVFSLDDREGFLVVEFQR